MLSYDWLKILGVIAVAAMILAVFFTMIATRATDGQTFMVYGYYGLSTGKDYSGFGDSLKTNNVFSYDILSTGAETFSESGMYGKTVFTARRSAGEGRVMFVSDHETVNDKGEPVATRLDELSAMGLVYPGEPREEMGMLLDPLKFMDECKAYLEKFFGENLANEEPDEAAVRDAFLKRNAKDKRYRKAAQKEEGIKSERKRVLKLKEDYSAVSAVLDADTVSIYSTTIDLGAGNSETRNYQVGIKVGKIAPRIHELFYYETEKDGEKVKSAEDLVLVMFDNGTREGDLRYDTVSFLAYLLKTYSANA